MRMKAVVLTGVLVLAGASLAQAQVRFAPQAAVGTESDFGIGGRINFNLANLFRSRGFVGIGEFNYFFPGDDVNYWELNGSVGYMIPNVRGNVKPYAGGGLMIGHASADHCVGNGCDKTDLGVNLLGGINIQTRNRIMPFVEGRIQLGGIDDQFVVTGGVYF